MTQFTQTTPPSLPPPPTSSSSTSQHATQQQLQQPSVSLPMMASTAQAAAVPAPTQTSIPISLPQVTTQMLGLQATGAPLTQFPIQYPITGQLLPQVGQVCKVFGSPFMYKIYRLQDAASWTGMTNVQLIHVAGYRLQHVGQVYRVFKSSFTY